MARSPAPPKEKKPVVTTKAPGVEALAKELIDESHPSLKLAGIKYGFYGEGKKQKRFGRARAIPEPTRVLLERPSIQFEVVISPGHWNRYNARQRRQALDEVLCSMSFDGKVARIEKPDFKGYRANILRYGVEGHEELEEAFRNIQLVLPSMAAGDVSPVPANVDPETGEITDAGPTAEDLMRVADKGAKPPRGKDGFGNALPKKRGAVPTGPQAPAGA
jgi:hypothetical protein